MDILKEEIDFVNTLDEKDLNYYYYNNFFNFGRDNEEVGGLGMAQIKLMSQNLIANEVADCNVDNVYLKVNVNIQTC